MKSSEILRKSEDLTIYWGFIMQYSDWNPDQTQIWEIKGSNRIMNNVMNEVDSKQLFHKANKYQNPSLWLLKYETNQLVHRPERRNKYKIPNNYNDPSLSSPEASTHWLVRREREKRITNITNITNFMNVEDFTIYWYEIHENC